MNKLLSIYGMAMIAMLFCACSSDDDVVVNELEGLKKVTTLSNDHHTIEFYTGTGDFRTGYNSVYFQVKNIDGSLVKDAIVSWTPAMHMMGMSHSCPASVVKKKEGAETTFGGFLVFQMAGNDMEYWELSLDYMIDGVDYNITEEIDVIAAPKRVVESFQASDERRYVLALVEPVAPRVATNDMRAVLYEMKSMTEFVPVEGFKVKIDPRMPGMNNHTSPNNTDLVQSDDLMYEGKLSLTMTGYWKINLQLLNSANEVVKGEPVSESNEGSSIYFELEF